MRTRQCAGDLLKNVQLKSMEANNKAQQELEQIEREVALLEATLGRTLRPIVNWASFKNASTPCGRR